MSQPRVYMGKGNVWGLNIKKPLGTSTIELAKRAEEKPPKPSMEAEGAKPMQPNGAARLERSAVGGGVSARKVLANAGLAMGSVVRMDGKGVGSAIGSGKPWVIKPSRYMQGAWKQRAEAARAEAEAVKTEKSSVKVVEEKPIEEVEPIEPIEKPIEAVEEAEKPVEAVAEQPKAEEAAEAAVEAETLVLGETAEVPTEAKGEVVGEELNLFGEVIGAEGSSLSPTEERLTEYLGAAESAVAEVKAAEAARGGEPGGGNVGKGKKKRRKRKHRR